MKYRNKMKVRPPEQFERFMFPVDLGTDGVVLVRTPEKRLVWFPGHQRYENPEDKNVYQPVSLQVVCEDKAVMLALGGRFDQLRYESLIKEMRSHLQAKIEVDDIDVRRRSFTTVFF